MRIAVRRAPSAQARAITRYAARRNHRRAPHGDLPHLELRRLRQAVEGEGIAAASPGVGPYTASVTRWPRSATALHVRIVCTPIRALERKADVREIENLHVREPVVAGRAQTRPLA